MTDHESPVFMFVPQNSLCLFLIDISANHEGKKIQQKMNRKWENTENQRRSITVGIVYQYVCVYFLL